MAEQHSSKGIMWATIAAAVILIAVIVPFTVKHPGSAASAGNADDATEIRIQPIAKFELAQAAAPVASGPKDGVTVFNTVCSACHATGAAGAPKAGDKAAWGPRIAQGKEVLYKSALGGKNAMPAKGGAAGLSDAEVKAAVDHMVGLAK
ncbi:MAG: c-type cytochrome [Bacteroidota bacterium]